MISVIVPVYNEETAVAGCLLDLDKVLKGFIDYEIIVVNDGSTDNTCEVVKQQNIDSVTIINHVENYGYGKSLYDGICSAKFSCIGIIDGDGSYDSQNIKELCKYYPSYDMVVGARIGNEYKKGFFKRIARLFFQFLVEYASGRKVPDANSGLRIFNKETVMFYKDSLCTGFSFTTTITLLFLLNHHAVKYIPIEYFARQGKSKVKHFKDSLRALQIITEAILYYNPLKLFLLIANLSLSFGLTLWILNHYLFSNAAVTIISAILTAGYPLIFSLGLIANQLRKIYLQGKRND